MSTTNRPSVFREISFDRGELKRRISACMDELEPGYFEKRDRHRLTADATNCLVERLPMLLDQVIADAVRGAIDDAIKPGILEVIAAMPMLAIATTRPVWQVFQNPWLLPSLVDFLKQSDYWTLDALEKGLDQLTPKTPRGRKPKTTSSGGSVADFIVERRAKNQKVESIGAELGITAGAVTAIIHRRSKKKVKRLRPEDESINRMTLSVSTRLVGLKLREQHREMAQERKPDSKRKPHTKKLAKRKKLRE